MPSLIVAKNGFYNCENDTILTLQQIAINHAIDGNIESYSQR